jgi:hypothetical protein
MEEEIFYKTGGSVLAAIQGSTEICAEKAAIRR